MSGAPRTRYSVRPSASPNESRELFSYVRELGLSPESAEGSVPPIRELSRKHAVYRIAGGGDVGWIVKRPRPGAAVSAVADLDRELDVYRRAGALPALARMMPPVRHLDFAGHTLVLGAVFPGTSELGRACREGPSLEASRQLGTDLGTLHRQTAGAHDEWDLSPSMTALSRIASAVTALPNLLPAVASRGEVLEHLHRLSDGHEPLCFVHGDLSWEETLVTEDENLLQVIDWESAGLGDPSWDVACILEEHVHLAEAGLTDLRAISRSMRAFLDAYLEAAGPALASDARVDRSIRLSGARLLETALALASSTHELNTARRLARRGLLLLRSASGYLPRGSTP